MTDRNRLVEENLTVAYKAAGIASRKYVWMEYQDLFQIACIGLLKARDKYDESLCVPFAVFAWKFAQGAIIDEMRHVDTRSRKVRQEDTATGTKSHRMVTMFRWGRKLQTNDPTPEITAVRGEVWKLVNKLKPQYGAAMRLYYGQGLTVYEVGQKLRVNATRITHIHKKSVEQLREMYSIS